MKNQIELQKVFEINCFSSSTIREYSNLSKSLQKEVLSKGFNYVMGHDYLRFPASFLDTLDFKQFHAVIPFLDYSYILPVLKRMAGLAKTFDQWKDVHFIDNNDEAFSKMFELASTFDQLIEVYRASKGYYNRGDTRRFILDKLSEFKLTFTGWRSVYTDIALKGVGEIRVIALNNMSHSASTFYEWSIIKEETFLTNPELSELASNKMEELSK